MFSTTYTYTYKNFRDILLWYEISLDPDFLASFQASTRVSSSCTGLLTSPCTLSFLAAIRWQSRNSVTRPQPWPWQGLLLAAIVATIKPITAKDCSRRILDSGFLRRGEEVFHWRLPADRLYERPQVVCHQPLWAGPSNSLSWNLLTSLAFQAGTAENVSLS